MKVHNYNADTGEYISTTEADESPLEPGVFLIPANATEIAPPVEKSGKVRVFSNGEWSHITDLRGTTYWLADGSEHTVTELGELPEGAMTTAPEKPALTSDQLAAEARAKRDGLLYSIEWRVNRYTQQKAAGVATNDTESQFVSVLNYAQELRDITKQSGFPDVIAWPIEPA